MRESYAEETCKGAKAHVESWIAEEKKRSVWAVSAREAFENQDRLFRELKSPSASIRDERNRLHAAWMCAEEWLAVAVKQRRRAEHKKREIVNTREKAIDSLHRACAVDMSLALESTLALQKTSSL